MKKTLFAALALCSFQALAADVDAVRAAAMKGDYQAQRNLAYGYAAYPYKGQDKNPMLGCAWYKVILLSGSERINDGDIGNVKVYCGKLSAEQQSVAEIQAQSLARKIYKH